MTTSTPAKKARPQAAEKSSVKESAAKASAVKASTANSPSLSQSIAERAYQIWQERGCQHGRDKEDWLAAEKELTAAR